LQELIRQLRIKKCRKLPELLSGRLDKRIFDWTFKK